MTIYYTYVLKSLKGKTLSYVGYTKNLKNRLKLHNIGKGAKFTRGRKWKLIYKEKFKKKVWLCLENTLLKIIENIEII